MIEIAICDDVREDAEMLLEYLKRTIYEIECDIFPNGIEFLDRGKEYDVVFLDYSMPGLSGEEVAVRLREKQTKSLLVFFTGSKEPTPAIFRVRPFRYLLKDMSPVRLAYEVQEILKKCHERKIVHFIYAKAGSDLIKVPVQEITYIELAKHGCIVHTMKEGFSCQYTLRNSLNEMDRKLGDSGFVRAHNSYIINLEHITRYEKNVVYLGDGIQLNISRAYRKRFDLMFQRFMLDSS